MSRRLPTISERDAAHIFVGSVIKDAEEWQRFPLWKKHSAELEMLELREAVENASAWEVSTVIFALELQALPNVFSQDIAGRLKAKSLDLIESSDTSGIALETIAAYEKSFNDALELGLNPMEAVADHFVFRLTRPDEKEKSEFPVIAAPLQSVFVATILVGLCGRWKTIRDEFKLTSAPSQNDTPMEQWSATTEQSGGETEPPTIRVHMLHPAGNRDLEWVIGDDVDQETVDQFQDPESGDLHAMTFLEEGLPRVFMMREEKWGKARVLMDEAGEYGLDAAVERADLDSWTSRTEEDLQPGSGVPDYEADHGTLASQTEMPELQQLAMNIDQLLTEYVAIHDDLLKSAWKKIFKPPAFKRSALDLGRIVIAMGDTKLKIDSLLHSQELPPEQRTFMQKLSHYSGSLITTVNWLRTIADKLALKADGDEYPIRDYREDMDGYKQAVQRYLALGEDLNSLYEAAFRGGAKH